MFIVPSFIIIKTRTQLKCSSIDEWIKQLTYTHPQTHTHTEEYYLALKENGNLAICDSLDEVGGQYVK